MTSSFTYLELQTKPGILLKAKNHIWGWYVEPKSLQLCDSTAQLVCSPGDIIMTIGRSVKSGEIVAPIFMFETKLFCNTWAPVNYDDVDLSSMREEK